MDYLMEGVYKWFVDKLKKNSETGYEYLMKYDHHSTHSFKFMAKVTLEAEGADYPEKKPYPASAINWLETRNFAPGWFNRTFSEMILELLAFDDKLGNVSWYCVKGGSKKIVDAMEKRLTTDPILKKNVTFHRSRRVVRVSYQKNTGRMSIHWKALSIAGSNGLKDDYTYVALTVSPQCMRLIDLTTCGLDYSQKSTILMLQPGPLIKVGIRFKNNWWGEDPHNITGGQSSTDRPVRNVVYPSYGGGESTTLIASYCWTKDAVNLGCWMHEGNPFDRKQLEDVILADLAAIHDLPVEFIRDQYIEMYPFDWTNNPNTLGAYALFGPGQFSTLLSNMSRPAAEGRLHFAGEAISTCHGWVAGAVDSADRVVEQITVPLSQQIRSLSSEPFSWPWEKPSTDPSRPGDPASADGRGPETQALHTMLSEEQAIKQLAISEDVQGKESLQREE
ncbi:flavin containing amine oxidase [Rhizoctonia solani AG-3 Rhs1AP]|uniref:Flavin containing amine oxidase n=2 Tax=Rhizoctonia solani AG-3 TaxID=1086053 RepID=A0A074RJ79_9AGAM|nr:flavin containing amine oxidase [Rhizoctonia solani AG-3 Rhs1AP]KEP45435.1 flavin containing amine oxidase [Rhizoctonia solani 123E]